MPDDFYREAKHVSRLLLTDGIFLIAAGLALMWPHVAHWLGWL